MPLRNTSFNSLARKFAPSYCCLMQAADDTYSSAANQNRRDGQGPVAGLDLGTNNCRLLVAEPRGAEFHVIDSFSRSVRLGDAIEATGALSDDAMDRTIEALKICADKVSRAGVSGFRAVATAACRPAAGRAAVKRGLPGCPAQMMENPPGLPFAFGPHHPPRLCEDVSTLVRIHFPLHRGPLAARAVRAAARQRPRTSGSPR